MSSVAENGLHTWQNLKTEVSQTYINDLYYQYSACIEMRDVLL